MMIMYWLSSKYSLCYIVIPMSQLSKENVSDQDLFTINLSKPIVLYTSLAVNVVILLIVAIGFIDYQHGTVNILTGGLLNATCTHYIADNATNHAIYAFKGKTIVNGVVFQRVNVTSVGLQSDCQVLLQSFAYRQLIEDNNPSATTYYDRLLKFHPSTSKEPIYIFYRGLSSAPAQPPI